MQFLENFGLEFLTDSEENAIALHRLVCAEGKAIIGYYGCPYINQHFGWVQCVVRTEINEEHKQFQVKGLDTHLSGVTRWTFEIGNVLSDITEDKLSKRVLAHRTTDGSGAAVITMVNADVLPSFLEGDTISAQMVGFPLHINYYENEEAYADAQPEGKNGRKMLLADGSMFPAGLFNSDKLSDDKYASNYMLIRGTVKNAQRGLVQFGEEKGYNYLDVIINTQFGDLEIVHTMEQLDEKERHLVKEGAVVNGIFVLSADVAIDEYKNGFVKDQEHNLALMRYVLQEGESERLRYALSEDVQYISEASNKIYNGVEEVIQRFKEVREANPNTPFFAHFADITKIQDGEEILPYSCGERCIIIAMREETDLESICFIESNEEGKISKIHITSNPRYEFKVEEKPEHPSPFDNIEIPKDIYNPILTRAKFHGFVADDVSKEKIMGLTKRLKEYNDCVDSMLDGMANYMEIEEAQRYRNIFAYAFVKAVELQVQYNRTRDKGYFTFPIDSFQAEYVYQGLYEPDDINEKIKEKLEFAYEYGAQFYKDFVIFRSRQSAPNDFDDELRNVLIFIQQIGEAFASRELRRIIYLEE